jgi:hypothetical protein
MDSVMSRVSRAYEVFHVEEVWSSKPNVIWLQGIQMMNDDSCASWDRTIFASKVTAAVTNNDSVSNSFPISIQMIELLIQVTIKAKGFLTDLSV